MNPTQSDCPIACLPLFRLKVSLVGLEEYIVYFNDSRLPAIDISWREGECFKDVFREAVRERVKRLSNPLPRRAAQ